MNTEEILSVIDECIVNSDFEELAKNLELLLNSASDVEASGKLSEALYHHYTSFKGDYLARILQIIINKKQGLAIVKHPENPFFITAVFSGSVELYDCYIEEAIEVFLKGKAEDEIIEYYLELHSIAQKLTDHFFTQYKRCIKGIDFNGVFGQYEKDERVSLIHQEDFEIMNDIVEKYNAILGRRDILKDLEKRAGIN